MPVNNIVLFDPNHRNNELERSFSRFQLPKNESQHFAV